MGKVRGPNKAKMKKRVLEQMLERLEEGIVIVEGKHDVETLRRLGIPSVPYSNFMGSNTNTLSFHTERKFYVMMDADKGGVDKSDKVVSLLSSMDNEIEYDTETGKRFLKMLGITSVEQAYRRVKQVLEDGAES